MGDNHFSFVCSSSQSLCIDNFGNIYGFGCNLYYKLGFNDNNISSSIPKQIENLINILSICCGDSHTICLNNDGIVYSFGSNDYWQLGIDNISACYIPQQINLPTIKQIACGFRFSCCITYDNELYTFGQGINGQLGIGKTCDKALPQKVLYINNIDFISCGGYYCTCKTYNNEIYSWGSGLFGQLGNGDYLLQKKPVKSIHFPSCIKTITSGLFHNLILTNDGLVYSCGSNNYGQVGINDIKLSKVNIPRLIENIPIIKKISCGDNSSYCIDYNNNLWCFGQNYYGQLGNGTKTNSYQPIQLHSIKNIIDISYGGSHCFIKTLDNKIYVFGKNNKSQTGIQSNKIINVPTQTLQDKEDIWAETFNNLKQKSARK